jgi:SAM-dependent methyltransferase
VGRYQGFEKVRDGQNGENVVRDAGQLGDQLRDKGSAGYEKWRLISPAQRGLDIDGIMQRQIAAFLPSQHLGHALDYGAGNSSCRQYISCDRYVTADVSQNLAGNIEHLLVPDERLAVEAASFDAVLLLDVLEHVPDPDFVFGEIKRVLTDNGRLFISVPFLYREHETPFDFARHTVLGMRERIARQQGKVRLSKAGNVHYTLLSLFLERGIANGELNRLGVLGRVVNRLLRTLVAVLAPLLCKAPNPDDGIYHHLLLEVSFT